MVERGFLNDQLYFTPGEGVGQDSCRPYSVLTWVAGSASERSRYDLVPILKSTMRRSIE